MTKKKNKIRVLGLIGFLMFIFTVLNSNIILIPNNLEENNEDNEKKGIFPVIAEDRGYIQIYNDSAFTGANGIRSGSGTQGDPYIISNWNISMPVSAICIDIANTTSYFEIRNCTLSGGVLGIQAKNVTHITIVNNTISNMYGFGMGGCAGILIHNSTDIKIIDNKISGLYGLAGMDGLDGLNGDPPSAGGNGFDGELCAGIVINISLKISISYNNISTIYGGTGGTGGVGGNCSDDSVNIGGAGGIGGDGGDIYGIVSASSNDSVIFNNSISNLNGGMGGDGGKGGNGSDQTSAGSGTDGGVGEDGGFGGRATGIYIDPSHNITTFNNTISNIFGGWGGNGGRGGDGGFGNGTNNQGGDGGQGGSNGDGGDAYGYRFYDVTDVSNDWNKIFYIIGGQGGNSGDGGNGGNMTDDNNVMPGFAGTAGWAGDGGDAFGFGYWDSANVNNTNNLISIIYAGPGGIGGNGGLAGYVNGSSINSNTGGFGGNGFDGGNGGDGYGFYYENSNYIRNDYNEIINIYGGDGGDGGNGTAGKNGTGPGPWGIGGGGGGDAGSAGAGGDANGIYLDDTYNVSSNWNLISVILAGDGGTPGIASEGGHGARHEGGFGGTGGWGGSGGDAYGINFNLWCSNITNTWNNITFVIAGSGTNGSDGAKGGNGDTQGTGSGIGGWGGWGGWGGFGGFAYGLYIRLSNYLLNIGNKIANVFGGDGGNGGNAGDGGNSTTQTGGGAGTGGDGRDGGLGVAIYLSTAMNITNTWNDLVNVTGGNPGIGGINGTAGKNLTSGEPGSQGNPGNIGLNAYGYGFNLLGAQTISSYQNYVYCENNTDNSGLWINWNSTLIGNYWDNYSGVDADDDGIGDTIKNITGNSGSKDYLPIWDDGDDLAPIIIINTPTQNQLCDATVPAFNVEIFDPNLNTTWYSLDGGNTNITFTNNGTFNQIEWDKLSNGTHVIWFYANDTLNNNGSSSVLIHKDIYQPSITIITPTDNQLLNGTAPYFEVFVNNSDDSSWYTLDGGLTNITFGTNETFDQAEWDLLFNGSVTIEFYCNHTTKPWIGYDSVVVLVDKLAPGISINFPTPGKAFNSTAPRFNVTIIDCNLNETWYTIDGGVTNHTFNTNETIDQGAWNSAGEGNVILIFYANDSVGNIDSTQVIIVKDTIDPTVTIYSPIDLELLGPIAPIFSVWSNDTNLDDMWYSLNGGSNITYGTNTTINQGAWDALSNGTATITFYANDTSGHIGSASVDILIDNTAPSLTINSPSQLQLTNSTAPLFNITAIDCNLNATWYTLDGGAINVTFTVNKTFDQVEWGKLFNGTVTIWFYANDSLGNIASDSVVVLIDILAPSITINFPNPSQVFNATAPRYDITIIDCNLDDIWYTIDGGSTNITIGANGTLDQTEWDAASGSITLIFYANDTMGNIQSSQVVISKDVGNPTVNIVAPITDDFLGITSAPSFNVENSDPNLDTLWYSLDGGITNITYITNTTFDQALWSALPNGTNIIWFYANDSAGNEGSDSVSVEIDAYIPQIWIDSPDVYERFETGVPTFIIRVNNSNNDSMWYTLNGGAVKYNFTVNGSIDATAWNALLDGSVIITFYANDTAGNIGYAQISVYKGAKKDADDDDDDEQPKFDILGFLTTPTGMMIVGIGIGAGVVFAIFKIKNRGYKGGGKEKERILRMWEEDIDKDKDSK